MSEKLAIPVFLRLGEAPLRNIGTIETPEDLPDLLRQVADSVEAMLPLAKLLAEAEIEEGGPE